MAKTQIRGNTQILAGTITNNEVAAAAGIASTKLAVWSANRDAGSNRLVSLADGVNPQDAVTLLQLQNQVQGLAPKGSVRVMADSNITLSGTQTIDGVALSVGDLVLCTGQTTGSANGAYVVASGAWTRTLNFDAPNDAVKGAYWLVDEGTNYAGTGWLLTNAAGYVIGTTALTFGITFGPGDMIPGAGLTRSGNTYNVGANADGSMTVNADDIQVHRDVAGAIGTSASGIIVLVGAATGLAIASNALGIKLDGASLSLSSNGLKVTTPTPNFADREVPSGAINGVNVTFTLAHTPVAGSEMVYINGQLDQSGAGNDYTISGSTITYLTAPITGDVLLASYRW